MSWEWNPPWSGSAFLSAWSLSGWGKPRNPHFQMCRKGENLGFDWNRGMTMPWFAFWLYQLAPLCMARSYFSSKFFSTEKKLHQTCAKKIAEILVFSKTILSCGFSKFLQVKEILMKVLEHWVLHLPFYVTFIAILKVVQAVFKVNHPLFLLYEYREDHMEWGKFSDWTSILLLKCVSFIGASQMLTFYEPSFHSCKMALVLSTSHCCKGWEEIFQHDR